MDFTEHKNTDVHIEVSTVLATVSQALLQLSPIWSFYLSSIVDEDL